MKYNHSLVISNETADFYIGLIVTLTVNKEFSMI